MMTARCPFRNALLLLAALGASAHATFLDDIGWIDLATRYGTNLTRGAGIAVVQVEAPEGVITNYFPNTNNAAFAGKLIVRQSGTGAPSSHATGVGGNFYGLNAIASGVTNVDVYEANNFVGSTVLKPNSPSSPINFSPARVMNHSWIGGGGGAELLRRMDHVVDQQRITVCSGLFNVTTNNVPLSVDLMAQCYNSIGVGLTRPPVGGNYNEVGPSTVDTTGRAVVMVTLPLGDTSSATAVTSSCATLLIGQALRTAALTNGADPRVVKALFLATATRLAGWEHGNAGTGDDERAPLDWAQGAGRLQINRAVDTLTAGEITTNSPAGVRGWDLARINANATNTYFLDIPTNHIAGITVALAWNRHVTAASTSTFVMRNLDLALHEATGLVATTTLARSTSVVDNVEYLFATNLPSGRYAITVSGGNANDTNALAYIADITPLVSVAATDSNAAEFGADPGTFTVTRPATNTALTVLYAVSGTATNGADYTTLPGSVVIPAGSNSAAITVAPLTDSLAEGGETVTLTLLPSTNYATFTNDTATVILADRPWDAWRFAWFTAGELTNTLVSGDAADPDSDGLPNLIEYASGFAPTTNDSMRLPRPVLLSLAGTNTLTLEFEQPVPVPPDITYQPEFSTDLLLWNTNTSFAPPAVTNGDGTRTVRYLDTSPAATNDHRSARLRVIRP